MSSREFEVSWDVKVQGVARSIVVFFFFFFFFIVKLPAFTF